MDRIRKAFRYADVEGKEFLTRHQYKVAMTVVFGYCPDKWDVKQVFSSSSNPGNIITFEQFQTSVRGKIDSASDLLDLKSLFAHLDTKFKGYLVLEDFLTAATDVNLRISTLIIKNVFKELDNCRRGFIGMDEFSAMMEYKR